MTVAPKYPDRVMPDLFHARHFQSGLKHRKRRRGFGRRVIRFLRLRPVRARATGAGAFVAQIRDRILAAVTVLPIDLDALRFGDRDMFGIAHHCRCQCARSTSRTPEIRRIAAATRSSCFLSLISTVMSITAPSPLRCSSPRASRLHILHCSANNTEVS